ncbi:hypothetical protein [Methanopyrus kandleri]|uniref:Uncharacterized protein n=1 Tax=Methanopyrus kandleri TaxID=2320 RepID=A0A832TBI3_9EURY|nr:hypothetical protein [Methanopyrus kandleri]HII71096.1 hypothetical protein [Methanopyrus kandleri]
MHTWLLLWLLLPMTPAQADPTSHYLEVHPDTVPVTPEGSPLVPAYVELTDEGKEAALSLLERLGIPSDEAAVGYLADVFVGESCHGGTRCLVVYNPQDTTVEVRPWEEDRLPLRLPPLRLDDHLTELLLCLPVREQITLQPAVLELGWNLEMMQRCTKAVRLHKFGEPTAVIAVYVPTETAALRAFESLLPDPRNVARAMLERLSSEVRDAIDEYLVRDRLERLVKSRLGSDVYDRVREYFSSMIHLTVSKIEELYDERVLPALIEWCAAIVRYVETSLITAFALLYPDNPSADVLERRVAVYNSPYFQILRDWLLEPSYTAWKSVLCDLAVTVADSIFEAARPVLSALRLDSESSRTTLEEITKSAVKNFIEALGPCLRTVLELLLLDTLMGLAWAC